MSYVSKRLRSGSGTTIWRGPQDEPTTRLRPGQIACPVCHNATTPLATGYLRRHSDPSGYPCANRKSP